MTYSSTVALNHISAAQSQKEVTFNEIAATLSKAAIFSIKTRQSGGLTLTLYGGVYPGASGPVIVADKKLTLTPSATNYVYVDAAGAIFASTIMPAGWPGPMATAYRALYQLVVGTDAITSGTSYLTGPGQPGVVGPIGPTGEAGRELYQQRRRVTGTTGNGATALSFNLGMAVSSQGSGLQARTVDGGFFTGVIPFAALSHSSSAGSSGAMYSTQNWCHLGTAAGRGGFDLFMRWCFESSFSGANTRRFFGLRDNSVGNFANANPDTFVNIIGVGNNSADSNLSIFVNDGSGTATTTLLESDDSPGVYFPARATDNTYELRLRSEPNSNIVTYSLLDAETGRTASGTINGNDSPNVLPAGGTFLGWAMWSNNGASSGTTTIGVMDLSCNTRY